MASDFYYRFDIPCLTYWPRLDNLVMKNNMIEFGYR